VKRLAATLLVIAGTVISVATAVAADPQEEKRRISAADNALAKRGLVVRSWLGTGWTRTAPSPESDADLDCPAFRNLDFSRFTITGEAESAFKHPSGTTLESGVTLFASRADAVGDFKLGLQPSLASCLRSMVLEEMRKDADEGVTFGVTVRKVAGLRAGERSLALRIVVQVKMPGRPAVPVYMDFVVFQKGRAHGSLIVMSVAKPTTGLGLLARAMASHIGPTA
jgi:hypothetical protein